MTLRTVPMLSVGPDVAAELAAGGRARIEAYLADGLRPHERLLAAVAGLEDLAALGEPGVVALVPELSGGRPEGVRSDGGVSECPTMGTSQVAQHLGIGERRVRRLVEREVLRGWVEGGRLVIDAGSVQTYQEALSA